MRTIVVSSHEFDIEGFTDSLLDFGIRVFGLPSKEKNLGPFVAIYDEDDSGDGMDWLSNRGFGGKGPKEFLAEGETLFFPFHGECVPDQPIRCADGNVIPAAVSDEELEAFPGWGSFYGFLLTAKDGTVRIESAGLLDSDCCCPPPITVREYDCRILDDPMEAFARRFLRE